MSEGAPILLMQREFDEFLRKQVVNGIVKDGKTQSEMPSFALRFAVNWKPGDNVWEQQ